MHQQSVTSRSSVSHDRPSVQGRPEWLPASMYIPAEAKALPHAEAPALVIQQCGATSRSWGWWKQGQQQARQQPASACGGC